MDLSAAVNQAVKDLGSYTDAAEVVKEDTAKLSNDQAVADSAAKTAQGSVQAAIAALTEQLASLPASTPQV